MPEQVKQENQLISFRRTELKALDRTLQNQSLEFWQAAGSEAPQLNPEEQQLAKGEKFLHRSLDANDPTKAIRPVCMCQQPAREECF